MARDLALFAALEAEGDRAAPLALPTLRLYAWHPWTVSLGNAQDPRRALDLERVSALGYAWVKRPTGGRAVFHAEEITYAVAAPLSGPFAGGLVQTHRAIAGALARFYRALGLETALSRAAGSRALDPRAPSPCFMAPGLAELEIAGRKLAGSAQRRGRRAFLQHGSLPLSAAHVQISELLPLDSAGRRRVHDDLARRSVSLGELLGRLPPREDLHAMLAEAFRAELDLQWC